MESKDRYIVSSYDIATDARLTKMQMRVLLALFSFRNNKTELVWPKRETLSKMLGYDVIVISRVTKQLVELGWLEKVGNGGRSCPCIYKIIGANNTGNVVDIKPKTVTNSVRVNDKTVTNPVPKTVTNSVRVNDKTVTNPVPKTVTNSVRGKELTKELTNSINNTRAREDVLVTKKSARAIKRKIETDWQPSERCFELLAKSGIDKTFALGLVDEFVFYWQERQERRAGWNSTFLNHAKRQAAINKNNSLSGANNAARYQPGQYKTRRQHAEHINAAHERLVRESFGEALGAGDIH